MRNLRHLALAAAAAGPLVGMGGSSALAAACVMGTVASYTTVGFSCSVNTDTGPVTFSNIKVTTTPGGTGTITLGDIGPFTTVVGGVTEYGLSLAYSANTGATAGSTADIAWTYSVSGTPSLTDAFAAFAGTVSGTGTQSLNEVLSNGTTLSLNSAGSTTATFSPVGSLSVIKDQNDFAGAAGSATSSVLQNAFSVTSVVPEPSTWAMMLLGFAGLGYAGFRSRKTSVSIA